MADKACLLKTLAARGSTPAAGTGPTGSGRTAAAQAAARPAYTLMTHNRHRLLSAMQKLAKLHAADQTSNTQTILLPVDTRCEVDSSKQAAKCPHCCAKARQLSK